MPKLKTKSAAKRRFKIKKVNGTLKFLKATACRRHGNFKCCKKSLRNGKGFLPVSKSNVARVRSFFPYA